MAAASKRKEKSSPLSSETSEGQKERVLCDMGSCQNMPLIIPNRHPPRHVLNPT